MILKAKLTDAESLASIHCESLSSGFLANLGKEFLVKLYKFLIKNEVVFVYKDQGSTKAFLSCSFDSAKMMKVFSFSAPASLFILTKKLIFSPKLMIRFLETFLIPFKSRKIVYSKGGMVLPSTELLSISVDPNCQQSGIGSQLLKALEEELINKGIREYKVIAGVSLEGANKFYLRNGFTLVSQLTVHGNELSNIYIKQI